MIRLVLIYATALGLLISLSGCGLDRSQIQSRSLTDGDNSRGAQASPTPWPTFSPNPTVTVTPTPTPLPNVSFNTPTLPALPYSDFHPILSTGDTAYNGTVQTNFCKTYGDPLDATKSAGRLAWAKHCFPVWNQWYQVSASVTTGLYPSFGRVGEDGKPFNNLNFIAPTSAIGACALPEGYMLVALCAPTR